MNLPVYRLNGDQTINMEDIILSIHNLGIVKNDTVIVHSDIKPFGKLAVSSRNELFNVWIEALKTCVGTLIMPTFSYSFCRREIFDVQHSASTVGVLTEYFRKLPNVTRTQDAIFSCAISGEKQKYYEQVGTNCFGENSIFDKLYIDDAKLLDIGNTRAYTFVHYIEQMANVSYRYMKPFIGMIRDNGIEHEQTFQYFVRRLDIPVANDLEKLAQYMQNQGVLKDETLGQGKLSCCSLRGMYDLCMTHLESDPYFLLTEPIV